MGKIYNFYRQTIPPCPSISLEHNLCTTLRCWHLQTFVRIFQCHNWHRPILWLPQHQHSIFLKTHFEKDKKICVTFQIYLTLKLWNQKTRSSNLHLHVPFGHLLQPFGDSKPSTSEYFPLTQLMHPSCLFLAFGMVPCWPLWHAWHRSYLIVPSGEACWLAK